MATITRQKTTPPKKISKFLGLNENIDGEYGLKLGEATTQLNYRITPQYQLKEREGYKTIFAAATPTSDIMQMWHGKLNGSEMFLFCADGHLYSGDLNTGTKTSIGIVSGTPTSFLGFGTKVYINNDNKYLSFDGITLAEVEGYVPKIAIGTPPTGGGTDYEQFNILTGKKHQTFNGDGSSKTFYIREQNVDSIYEVWVDGVKKTLTTDYTVNTTAGTVTFISAPSNVADTVDIYWQKGTGNRSLIEGCRFSMDYSGQTDSRVFLWGNTTYKNRRFWSGIANGMPSAEYFEVNSYDDLGSGQYAITDIVKQYDRQKIFLENTTMYSYYEAQTTIVGENTVTIVTFPTFELSEEVGNVAEGQVQIIKNSPMAIYQGIHAFKSSTVRDQTNNELVSNRVQDSLITADLSKAITVNWQKKGEYWCNIGDIVWVYNYVNDTWYKFDNIEATCFLEVNGELYFGTKNGTIEKFDELNLTDNGVAINAVWEMGFYDFDAEWLTKFLTNAWVSISPHPKSRVDVSFATNEESYQDIQTIRYQLMTFKHMNFDSFSFRTSYNPQPFYIDIQAMGFCYFRIRLSNSSLTETVTVLSINLPVRYGGKV